jgi:hypothetical protein
MEFSDSDHPPFAVRVTHINQHDHLQGIKRPSETAGATAHDPNQKDIRSFFGGGGAAQAKPPAQQHSASNVEDQPAKALDDDSGKL